jgi:signal transduction histidine kinase
VAPVPLDRRLDDAAVPPGLVVLADRSHLERVLVNLLVNAWRYGGPTVRVAAEPVGDRVQVVVTDDGEGVPSEVVAHLFEPFRRGPQRHPEASGLGLAIVERLVRAMGGSIRYEPGDPGATFTVTLDGAG